jgi:hypothetical protein
MTAERTLVTAERTKRVKYADMEVPGVQIVPLAYEARAKLGAQLAKSSQDKLHVRASKPSFGPPIEKRRMSNTLRNNVNDLVSWLVPDQVNVMTRHIVTTKKM